MTLTVKSIILDEAVRHFAEMLQKALQDEFEVTITRVYGDTNSLTLRVSRTWSLLTTDDPVLLENKARSRGFATVFGVSFVDVLRLEKSQSTDDFNQWVRYVVYAYEADGTNPPLGG